MTFGDLRFYGSKLPEGFANKLVGLGAAFGLLRQKALGIIAQALEVTAEASAKIRSAGVDDNVVDRFDALVRPVRSAIAAVLV